MSNTHFIIEQVEEKNTFMQLCFFSPEIYEQLNVAQEWIPMKRLLVDSENKQIIYVMDVNDKWEYIRFPVHTWSKLDQIIAEEQDLLLVLSKTKDNQVHKSILLKDFVKEGKELVLNMRSNTNYGEEMAEIVEKHFSQTIQQLA